jgi:hypothetical protein
MYLAVYAEDHEQEAFPKVRHYVRFDR